MNSSDQRKRAAFHLHVQGPPLVWFGQLPEGKRATERSVQSEFRNIYFSTSLLDLTLALDSAMLSSLTPTLNQPLEDYYGTIHKKARIWVSRNGIS